MKIYTTLAPTPSRVLGLVRLLEANNREGISRRELCRLMDPTEYGAGTAPEPDAVRELFQAGLEARILEEYRARNEPHIRLITAFPEGQPFPTPLSGHLQNVLARLLLRPEIGGEPNGFALVCAWFLAQPIGATPQGHNELMTALARSGFPLSELHLNNPARVDMILYWARYLGLVERMRLIGGSGVIPDPSAFLRRHLQQLLPTTNSVLSAAEFRTCLGNLCPPLDGGSVRATVLSRLRVLGAPPWPEGRFSDALSFAIRRLHIEGHLHWTYIDDSQAFLELTHGERVNFFHQSPTWPGRTQ
jgi:hypothetical protein